MSAVSIADHDRFVGRAHDLDAKVGDRSGDAQARIVGAGGGEPVRSFGELERHARPPRRHPQDVAQMVASRLSRASADRDGDPRGSQPRVPLSADERIGIFHRRDDAGDARRDDCVDAGRRGAEMRAGLKRHIERRAARRLAGLGDRDPLGMRPSARRCRPAPDDRPVLHQDRADSGIGSRKAERPRSQIERRLHPAQILIGVCGCAFAHVAGAFRRWRGASFAGAGSAQAPPPVRRRWR